MPPQAKTQARDEDSEPEPETIDEVARLVEDLETEMSITQTRIVSAKGGLQVAQTAAEFEYAQALLKELNASIKSTRMKKLNAEKKMKRMIDDELKARAIQQRHWDDDESGSSYSSDSPKQATRKHGGKLDSTSKAPASSGKQQDVEKSKAPRFPSVQKAPALPPASKKAKRTSKGPSGAPPNSSSTKVLPGAGEDLSAMQSGITTTTNKSQGHKGPATNTHPPTVPSHQHAERVIVKQPIKAAGMNLATNQDKEELDAVAKVVGAEIEDTSPKHIVDPKEKEQQRGAAEDEEEGGQLEEAADSKEKKQRSKTKPGWLDLISNDSEKRLELELSRVAFMNAVTEGALVPMNVRNWVRLNQSFGPDFAVTSRLLALQMFILASNVTHCHFHTWYDHQSKSNDVNNLHHKVDEPRVTGVPYPLSRSVKATQEAIDGMKYTKPKTLKAIEGATQSPKTAALTAGTLTLEQLNEFFRCKVEGEDGAHSRSVLHCGCDLEEVLLDFFLWKENKYLLSTSTQNRELYGAPMDPRSRQWCHEILIKDGWCVDDMYQYGEDGARRVQPSFRIEARILLLRKKLDSLSESLPPAPKLDYKRKRTIDTLSGPEHRHGRQHKGRSVSPTRGRRYLEDDSRIRRADQDRQDRKECRTRHPSPSPEESSDFERGYQHHRRKKNHVRSPSMGRASDTEMDNRRPKKKARARSPSVDSFLESEKEYRHWRDRAQSRQWPSKERNELYILRERRRQKVKSRARSSSVEDRDRRHYRQENRNPSPPRKERRHKHKKARTPSSSEEEPPRRVAKKGIAPLRPSPSCSPLPSSQPNSEPASTDSDS